MSEAERRREDLLAEERRLTADRDALQERSARDAARARQEASRALERVLAEFREATRREIAALQAQLGQLYAARGSDLQWLMSLAERQGALTPVTLDEFWGGGQAIAGERQVPARFTSKGKRAIDDFYKEFLSSPLLGDAVPPHLANFR